MQKFARVETASFVQRGPLHFLLALAFFLRVIAGLWSLADDGTEGPVAVIPVPCYRLPAIEETKPSALSRSAVGFTHVFEGLGDATLTLEPKWLRTMMLMTTMSFIITVCYEV